MVPEGFQIYPYTVKGWADAALQKQAPASDTHVPARRQTLQIDFPKE